MYTKCFVYYLISLIVGNEAAKILAVFPTTSISHQVVFRPLTQELAKRGHQVTVVTPDPAFPEGKAPTNLLEIDVHDLSYKIWADNFLVTSTGKKSDLNNQLKVAFRLGAIIFREQMKTDHVQSILRDNSQSFDLLLLEACAPATLALSYKFKVPVIQVSSFGGLVPNFELMGAPWHPIVHPQVFSQRSFNHSLYEKISEFGILRNAQNALSNLKELYNQISRELCGPEVPDLSELGKSVDMLILNSHHIWDRNRPVPPSVIYTGSLHISQRKELPKDLETYLNASTHGVIYVSFGTNVEPSLLSAEKIKKIIKVFSELPYDILIKWNQDELPGRSANIRISKWLPQFDLLHHPNIKLFITQGGLQSTDEAIRAGVPMIGVPMLGDQWFNVDNYVYFGIGKRIDFENFVEEQFKQAITTVIEDKSYHRNIVKLRSLMMDQPQSPLQRAVWWTEYVLRHGGATHLRSPSANMSWTEYYQIDLIIVFSLIAIFVVTFLYMVIYYIFKCISRKIAVKLKMS